MAKKKNGIDQEKSIPHSIPHSSPHSSSLASPLRHEKAGRKAAKQADKKPVVAEARAWQQRQTPPLARAPAAEASSRLLALLNGAEFQVAGGLWRCRAQQILTPSQTPSPKKQQGRGQGQGQGQGRWSLRLSLGGVSCLCHTTLPTGLRGKLEAMSEPYRLEELPASVVLGLLTLALTPLFQELFVVPCSLVEQGIDIEEEASGDAEDILFLLDALPIVQKEEEDLTREPLRLRCRLAASDLEAFGRVLGRALRVRRLRREYPSNLHTTWLLDAGGSTISLEEFQALKEGDVLLLS